MSTPLTLTRRGVRRFLLDALDLDHDGAYHPGRTTPEHVLREIRRLEVVQLDPVAAVERNQHLVLANRLRGYRPAMLETLLEQRRVFEYWANAACVIPIEDYWMFAGVRARLRRGLREERATLRKPAALVLRELERNGPLPSRAFLTDERIAGYWDNKGPRTKATSHALNVLWDTGEVMVVRREGVERYFDLPHKVVPPNVLRHADGVPVTEADAALLDKYLRAYRVFEVGDFRFGWRKIPAPQRREIVAERVRRGDVAAPIVIGRDHLDTGSVASPNRETEGLLDGTDAVSDWPLLNAMLNAVGGATWVSFHHGGGVGIGYSQHAGQVIVADGTPEAARRLERVLTTDPGLGIVRHADAGYPIAIAAARRHAIRMPMLSKD